MSDTKAATAPFNSTTSLQNCAALIAAVAIGNYAAVWAGYQPVAYCMGERAIQVFGLAGWYHAVGVIVAVGAFASFALSGFNSSLRWLVFLALWLALPGWLEQGFGLGATDRCPLMPTPLY